MNDCIATEKQRTPTGAATIWSRAAVIALACMIGGDDAKPRQAQSQPDGRGQPNGESIRPSDLSPGESIIGRRLLVARDGTRDLVVEVLRRNGAIELNVDGKTYRIQETMGVSVGRCIDRIDMGNGTITVDAPEYGVAIVTRAETERALEQLADANTDLVRTSVRARFEATPGSPLAAAIRIKRMWNGGKCDENEYYDVGFVRVPQNKTLAMRQ